MVGVIILISIRDSNVKRMAKKIFNTLKVRTAYIIATKSYDKAIILQNLEEERNEPQLCQITMLPLDYIIDIILELKNAGYISKNLYGYVINNSKFKNIKTNQEPTVNIQPYIKIWDDYIYAQFNYKLNNLEKSERNIEMASLKKMAIKLNAICNDPKDAIQAFKYIIDHMNKLPDNLRKYKIKFLYESLELIINRMRFNNNNNYDMNEIVNNILNK